MRVLALLMALGLLLAGCTEPAPEGASHDDSDAGLPDNGPGPATPDPDGADSGSDEGDAGTEGDATTSEENATQPPPTFSGTFHLHAEGDRRWMDAQVGPEGTVTGTNAPGQPNTYHRFVLDPAVDADHAFGAFAFVKVHWSVQQGVNADMDARARLVVAGVAYEAVETEHGLRVDLPDGVAAGDEVALEVCVCGSETAASGYVIDLDERTWVRFSD